MKKIILAAVISASILSCKQEVTTDYKYADQPQTLACENVDTELYSEAYYAFENAIITHAKNTNRRPNFNVTADYALKSFISRSRGNIRITDYVTEEAFLVFNTLKGKDIWDGTQLKNSAAVTECIGNSISNTTIKGSFNTLRSVESLNPKLMVSAMTDNRYIRDQYKDKALMTYAALDLFYAKFFNTDFSKTTFLVAKEAPTAVAPTKKLAQPEIGKKLNLDVKKKPAEKHDAHDGHNH